MSSLDQETFGSYPLVSCFKNGVFTTKTITTTLERNLEQAHGLNLKTLTYEVEMLLALDHANVTKWYMYWISQPEKCTIITPLLKSL